MGEEKEKIKGEKHKKPTKNGKSTQDFDRLFLPFVTSSFVWFFLLPSHPPCQPTVPPASAYPVPLLFVLYIFFAALAPEKRSYTYICIYIFFGLFSGYI